MTCVEKMNKTEENGCFNQFVYGSLMGSCGSLDWTLQALPINAAEINWDLRGSRLWHRFWHDNRFWDNSLSATELYLSLAEDLKGGGRETLLWTVIQSERLRQGSPCSQTSPYTFLYLSYSLYSTLLVLEKSYLQSMFCLSKNRVHED